MSGLPGLIQACCDRFRGLVWNDEGPVRGYWRPSGMSGASRRLQPEDLDFLSPTHFSKQRAPISYVGRSWRPGCGWNFARRSLRKTDGIGSGYEVNWLIDGRCGEGLPAIDLAKTFSGATPANSKSPCASNRATRYEKRPRFRRAESLGFSHDVPTR
jgi:hypothetical protein